MRLNHIWDWLPATDTSSVWLVTLGKDKPPQGLALRASPIYTDALPLAGQLMPGPVPGKKPSMRQLVALAMGDFVAASLSSGVASLAR